MRVGLLQGVRSLIEWARAIVCAWRARDEVELLLLEIQEAHLLSVLACLEAEQFVLEALQGSDQTSPQRDAEDA